MPAPTPPSAHPATPDTPDRNEGQDVFNTKAFTWNDWFAPFSAWVDTVVTYFNAAITYIEPLVASATDSASSASASATSAAASASSAINSPGTNATSTSSITPAIGSNSFTLAQTGKTFVVNQFVTVANSPTKFFTGAITEFNSGTGAMTVDARTVEGTGSASAWTITASAPAQGETFTAPVQKFVNLGTVSGTVNIDLRSGLKYSFTTSGNITINPTLPSLATSSTEVEAVYKITKGGSHTITWPVGTQWSDGAPEAHNSGATNEYVATKEGSGAWINSTSRKNIS